MSLMLPDVKKLRIKFELFCYSVLAFMAYIFVFFLVMV